MKQTLALSLSALAIVSPLYAIDHHARSRIAKQQRQIDRLNYRLNLLDSELANVAECTSIVYPITFAPNGALYLSPSPQYDRAFMPDGKDGGCPAS